MSRWLPLILALAFTFPARAEVDRAAVVAQLMKQSGVDQQMNSYAKDLAEQILAQAQPSKQPGIEVELADSARTEFAEALLLRDIRQDLVERFDAERMAAALRWLESPAGRRLTAIEERGSRELDEQGIEAYTERMATEPPPTDRIVLVQRLDETRESSERATSVVLLLLRATMLAFNAASPKPTPESRLRANLEAERSRIQHEVAETVFATLLMVYEEASDEDLEAYIAFSQKPEGRWYTDTVSQAVLRALENAADRTVQSAARLAQRPAAKGAR